MSATAGRGIRLAAALLCAALFQALFASSITFHGAHPDFLLSTLLLGAMFCNGNEGAFLGFFGGMLYASLAAPPGPGVGSLLVTRTLAGFTVGWLEEHIFRDSPMVAQMVVTLGTVLTEGLFFIFAPQRSPLHWFVNLGLTTLFNSLLAFPLYFLIRTLLGPYRLSERAS